MSVTIDAKGRAIGRVASEAAKILIGKHKVDFARNKLVGENVEILNAGLVKVTDKKLIQKV
ncbi:MAG: uL13 family ribosomal protein, partial [Candidatus Pacebacteria bacterium]|nr:uL13 family ribosomal protein [Candidatus Paceibacterota bacterium]